VKNKYILCVFFFLLVFYVFAQEETSPTASQNILLARSSADYRVTPGDVYTLTYTAGSAPVSYVITVDPSYRIRVSNMGIVNGAGKTFMQLKNEIENVVTNNYPLSGVQLVLTQPAVFKVYINGEVQEAKEVTAWGLSRLSTLVDRNLTDVDRNISNVNRNLTNVDRNLANVNRNLTDVNRNLVDVDKNIANVDRNLTDYASIRDISVKSSNGQTRVYDLFKTRRFGDFSHDPYLRPGDVITFNRVKRSVIVDGEVKRRGLYQLLDGENLKDLIEVYADGFTPLADTTRIEMTRMVNSVEIAGDKIFLSNDDIVSNYALEHLDSIFIPSVVQLQSVLFVEGAVGIDITSELHTTNRFMIQFPIGETYASLVRKNATWFSAVSDTENAYILRRSERIPININNILYNISFHEDTFINDEDTLVIPFRQYFVTVSGSVLSPGRYPYIPERDWEYYIGLAGGFVPERNTNKSVTIRNPDGKKIEKTDAILPETNITAETNHFLYFFNQYAPVITTVLSIITAFLTVMAISK